MCELKLERVNFGTLLWNIGAFMALCVVLSPVSNFDFPPINFQLPFSHVQYIKYLVSIQLVQHVLIKTTTTTKKIPIINPAPLSLMQNRSACLRPRPPNGDGTFALTAPVYSRCYSATKTGFYCRLGIKSLNQDRW